LLEQDRQVPARTHVVLLGLLASHPVGPEQSVEIGSTRLASQVAHELASAKCPTLVQLTIAESQPAEQVRYALLVLEALLLEPTEHPGCPLLVPDPGLPEPTQ